MFSLAATYRCVTRRAVSVGALIDPTRTIIRSNSNRNSNWNSKLRFSSSSAKTNDIASNQNNKTINLVDRDDHLRNPQDHRLCNEAYQGTLRIEETPDGKGMGLFASRNFETGDLVMAARATRVTTVRDSHTVQMDWDSHVLMDLPAVLVNHSCSANLGIRNSNQNTTTGNKNNSDANLPPVFDFWAIRPISEGDELTWDYEAAEWELSTPFECGCGSQDCRGTLKGFKHNGHMIQERYGEHVVDFLKEVKKNDK